MHTHTDNRNVLRKKVPVELLFHQKMINFLAKICSTQWAAVLLFSIIVEIRKFMIANRW